MIVLFELFDKSGAVADIDESGEHRDAGGGPPKDLKKVNPAVKDRCDFRRDEDCSDHSQLQGRGEFAGEDGNNAELAGKEKDDDEADEEDDVFSDDEDDDGGWKEKAINA